MAVFPTAFIPTIAWFQQFIAANKPVIDLGENFVKQTYRNRTLILSANGPVPIIAPIQKTQTRKVIYTEISYTEDWMNKHLRAIRSGYKNSPYYEHYGEEFEELLMRKEPLLYQYNKNILGWLLKELDVHIIPQYSNEYLKEKIENDFRNLNFLDSSTLKINKEYKQVFGYKVNFAPNLSVIDLLFNKGPESPEYLMEFN